MFLQFWFASLSLLYVFFTFLYNWRVKCSQTCSAVMLGIHRVLSRMHPEMVTILAPRDPRHGVEIAQVWHWSSRIILQLFLIPSFFMCVCCDVSHFMQSCMGSQWPFLNECWMVFLNQILEFYDYISKWSGEKLIPYDWSSLERTGKTNNLYGNFSINYRTVYKLVLKKGSSLVSD